MSRLTRRIAPLIVALGLLAPSRARAVAFGLGLHDWFSHGPLVEAHIGTGTNLLETVALGVRAGLFYDLNDNTAGIPLDAQLRLKLHPIYVEGLIGPWIVFRGTNAFRGHYALGIGYQVGAFSAGLEAGSLGGAGIAGAKVETGW